MTELSAVNSYVSRAWLTCGRARTHRFQELVEQRPSIVRARRRFGMVLDAKDGPASMPQSLDGPVVEIDVGHPQFRRTGNLRIVPRHGETVVLGGDEHAIRVQF